MSNSNTFKKKDNLLIASLIFNLIAIICIIVMFFGMDLISLGSLFGLLFSILAISSSIMALVRAIKRKDKSKRTLIVSFLISLFCLLMSSLVLRSSLKCCSRSPDVPIFSDMDRIRAAAEIFHGNNNTYAGMNKDKEIQELVSNIAENGGVYSVYINKNGRAYCAVARLNSGRYWCVDSNLQSKDYGRAWPAACVASCEQNNNCTCGTEAPSTPRNKNSG